MKRIISLILCLILALGIFGCAKEPDAPEIPQSEPVDSGQGKTVVCCIGAVNNPVNRVVQYGFCTKAQELQMNPVVSGINEGPIQELIEKWNSDIAANNAVGVMLWTGDDSCYKMMKALKQQGIYTVVPYFIHTFDYTKSYMDANPYAPLVEIGADMADKLVDTLVSKGINTGTVLVASDGPGSMQDLTLSGFMDRMRENYPDYNLPYSVLMGGDVDYAVVKGNDALMEYDDIVAVVGVGTIQTEAWCRCMEENDLEDIVIFGVGNREEQYKLVADGKVDMLACLPYYEAGIEAADMLYQLINGKAITNIEEWNKKLNYNFVYPNGEGENNIQTYRDIYNAAQSYFGG